MLGAAVYQTLGAAQGLRDQPPVDLVLADLAG